VWALQAPPVKFARSDVVFVGRVVPAMPPLPFSDYRHVSFMVKESWKGVTTARVTFRTERLCGYSFGLADFGQEYLVYAKVYPQHGGLYIAPCSGSIISTGAHNTLGFYSVQDDLTYLQTIPTLALRSNSYPVWGIMLFMAGLLLALFWAVRRTYKAFITD